MCSSGTLEPGPAVGAQVPLFKEHLQGRGGQGCKVLTCSVAVVRKPVGCGVFNSFGSKYLLDSLCMASLEVITA